MFVCVCVSLGAKWNSSELKKTTSKQESSHALDQYYWDDPYYIPVSYWSMMFGLIFNSCILMGVKGVNEPVPEDDVDLW